jgi:hypothetical protein
MPWLMDNQPQMIAGPGDLLSEQQGLISFLLPTNHYLFPGQDQLPLHEHCASDRNGSLLPRMIKS